MATPIGTLVVEMVANTAKFAADMNAARGVASQASRAIQGSFNAIGGSITGVLGPLMSFRNIIGTALGSAGLGLLIRNAVQAGDRIVEMAQRVGVSTDAIQELGYAASLSGASVEELENGLRFLNKSLGDAQTGAKEAADTFRKIGVDPTQFRDAGEAIGAVADGLLTLGNEAQRTEARLALFGRGGNQLAILLNEGSAGIAKFREEAQRLGIIIDREMLKQTQKLADDFDRLSAVISTNFTKALIAAAPLLIQFGEEMAKTIKIASEFWTRLLLPPSVLESQEQLASRLADVTAELDKARKVLESGAAFRAGQQAAQLEKIKGLEQERDAIRALIRERYTLDRIADQPKKPIATADPTKLQPKSLDEFRNKLVLMAIPDDVAKSFVQLRQEVNKLAEAGGPLGGTFREIGAAMEDMLVAKAAAEALKKVEEESRRLMELGDAGWIAAIGAQIAEEEELEAAIRRVNEAQFAADKALEAQGIADLIASIDAEKQAYEDELLAINRINEETFRANQVNERLIQSLQQQIDMFSMSEQAAAIYADQLKLGADATAEMRLRTAELSAQLFELKRQQEEQKQFYADLKNIVVNTALTASDALVDFALTGEISFKRLADAIIKDILRIITKMLILKAIEASITAFGGGTSPAMAGTVNYGGSVGGLAEGGIVKARPGGSIFRIAEAGKDEAIIPLDRMGSLGGGGVTVVNEIHNHTDARVTTQQQQMADGRLINKIIIDTVNTGLGDGTFDPVMRASYGNRRQGVAR